MICDLPLTGSSLFTINIPSLPFRSAMTIVHSLYRSSSRLRNMAGPVTIVIREMFYLTTHSTHFIYGYMASDIWLRTVLIVRKETRCCHIGYSYRLTARVLLYASSHRQDNTYHGLCYTSHRALATMRNSSSCVKSKLYALWVQM